MQASQSADKFFSSYAHDFDSIYGGSERGIVSRFLDRLFRKSMWLRYQRSLAGCQPVAGKSILDVGCGPGHYSVALAKQGAARVVGLDFADGMLVIANANAAKEGVTSRCQFLRGDLMTYSFDEKFDFAIVCGVMDYISEPEKFVHRVTDLATNKAFFSFPKASGLLARIRAHRYRDRCPLYLYGEDRLRQIFGTLKNSSFKIDSLARDYFVTVDIFPARRSS